MKRSKLLIALLTIIYSSIFCQDDVYSRLFIYNQGMYNPAATGLNCKSYVISDFSVKFLKFTSQPFRFNSGFEYYSEKINSTFSTYYYYNQAGTLTNTQAICLSYNYRFKISSSFIIKTGLQFNIIRRMLDFDQLTNADQIDQITGDIEINQETGKSIGIKPDINFGILVELEHFSFGASVINVFRPAFLESKSGNYIHFQLPRYLTFLTKYDIQISDKFILTPSIYYFSHGKNEFDFSYLDFTANLSFLKIINLGAVFSVGNIYRISVFSGIKIINKLNIQFCYWLNSNKDLNTLGPVIEGLVSYSIN